MLVILFHRTRHFNNDNYANPNFKSRDHDNANYADHNIKNYDPNNDNYTNNSFNSYAPNSHKSICYYSFDYGCANDIRSYHYRASLPGR